MYCNKENLTLRRDDHNIRHCYGHASFLCPTGTTADSLVRKVSSVPKVAILSTENTSSVCVHYD